jgi:hypothetical protein
MAYTMFTPAGTETLLEVVVKVCCRATFVKSNPELGAGNTDEPMLCHLYA